jgi:CubicO group peptidase (beta-lactamase class C family)
MRLSSACALLAALACLRSSVLDAAAPPLAAPESVGFAGPRLQRLDTFMHAMVDRGERAGIATLVGRNGHIVQLGEYGLRDISGRKPMRADTLVRISGMTEPVTAVAVMMLYEQGMLQLEDPIGDYLPEFAPRPVPTPHTKGGNRRVPAAAPTTAPVTIHQLLIGTARTAVPSAEVLAHLVEVVAQQPFEQFLEQRLFRPLNMVDTSFKVPPDKRDRLAEVYQRGPRGSGLRALSQAPGSGGGLVSTALDFWNFAQMLANGGELEGVRILSPATVALMFRASPEPLNAPAGHSLGLGLAVLTNPERYGVAGTSGLARSSGALGTTFWIDPDKQIVAILVTQYSGEPSDRLTRAFQALVYQAVTD